jgi:hypothetical protein
MGLKVIIMPSVELTDEQVVELVKPLPAERRRAALAEGDGHLWPFLRRRRY